MLKRLNYLCFTDLSLIFQKNNSPIYIFYCITNKIDLIELSPFGWFVLILNLKVKHKIKQTKGGLKNTVESELQNIQSSL